MLRKLLGTGLLLATLAGCTKLEGRTCTTDDDCGQEGLCDTAQGICYAADIEDTDGGTCSPACAEYEACTRNGCRPRFTALNILSPANNAVLSGSTDGGVDGGAVEVVAELVANPLYASTTQFPPSLAFSATLSGGGAAGTFGPVVRTDGTYRVPWTPPMVQGQIALTAAHPIAAAGLSNTVNVTVDSVPPTFDITFSAPPTRATPGNVTVADQRDPTVGFDTAFRRDESVTVTVSANETVASVTLTVTGIGPGGSPGQTQTLTLAPAGTCGASPYCGAVTVDLSTLDMRAFRGTMVFRVEGQDGAGNRGTDTADLPVTRWKWMYDGVGNIVGSPAVGAQGTVYIGTNVTTLAGKVYALNPDGTRKWETTVGDVSGSPAVGAFNAGEEYVYIAGRTGSGSFLYALRFSDGTEKAKCSYTNATEVPGALAVGPITLGVVTSETGLAIYNGNPVRIVGIRPDVLLTDRCPEVSGTGGSAIPASGPGSSLVLKDQNLFYTTGLGGPGPRITSYDFASGSNTARAGFPQSTSHLTRGLASAGDKIYGGAGNSDDPSLGSLFSISASTGGAITPVYPTAGSSRVFNLAIGAGDVAFFGAETATTAELLSLQLGTTNSPTRVAGTDTLRGAPVLGKNDRLYTVNAQGKVTAWVASTLAPLWNLDLTVDLSMKDSSPTLDCRRDAGGNAVVGATTGTLYFIGSAKLYAFIVDSPGLASNAPWPKFQHDARNTGNPATPVTNCP
jgi:outer membrane protein assembly factor BamB